MFGNGEFRSSDRYRKTAKNCVGDDETTGTHASARTPTENWITTTGFFIRARPATVRRLGGSSCGRVRWRIAIPRFRQHWLTLCADDHTRAFVVNEPKTRLPRASLSVHRSGGYLPCVYNLRLLCKLICFFPPFLSTHFAKSIRSVKSKGRRGVGVRYRVENHRPKHGECVREETWTCNAVTFVDDHYIVQLQRQ